MAGLGHTKSKLITVINTSFLLIIQQNVSPNYGLVWLNIQFSTDYEGISESNVLR